MTLLPYELSFINHIYIFGSDRAGRGFTKHKLESKQGLIIKIEKDNITSYADVSPLPYLNFETIEAVTKQCKEINTNQIFSDIEAYLKRNKDLFKVEKFLDFDFSVYTSYPSLQHGLSCLFSDYYRKKMGIKISGEVLFHGLLPNQLTDSSNDLVIKKAIALEKAGFKKAKIKIGSTDVALDNLKKENELLKSILKNTKALKLRLDANRKFQLNDFPTLLEGIDLKRIDYVEEPVSKTSELLNFTQKTKLTIAIDENINLAKDVIFEKISAVVLKPTLLGDYHNLKKIMSNYAKRNIEPIISSCFESQLGIYQLAQIASVFNPNESHGLDTFDCYLEKLLDLDIHRNAISLDTEIELKGPIYI